MAGTVPTIGLSFIAKTQEQADALIDKYGKYFDDVFYRVGKVDDFAKARNIVLKKVTTDYWFWCDHDDELIGIENIREIVLGMRDSGADVVDLAYEYSFNEIGECILIQWRERILKNSEDFHWKGRVHETVIAEGSDHLRVKDDRILVRHNKTQEEVDASVERNHKLLLKSWEEEQDPRTAHYLGVSHMNRGEYEEAIDTLGKHIDSSGWPEEQYRSWLKIAESWKFLGNYQMAIRACNEAIDLEPKRPEAFFLKAQFLLDTKKFEAALSAVEDGRNRPYPSETLSPVDKTMLTYRPLVVAAIALLNLGKIKEAWTYFSAAKKYSPKFELLDQLKPLFEGEYGALLAVEKINWLSKYLKVAGGRPEKLFEALSPSLFTDVRLNQQRNAVIKPKKWSDKSLVFFCGESAEHWGPDTLDKGMGGSEEAVLYLSRELAKLGYEVTVYCERDDELADGDAVGGRVLYLPWTAMNPNDEFNIFVSWRRPTLFSAFPIKAKVKLVDLHDAPVGHVSIGKEAVATVDKFMFKSNFQRNIASHIPDDKIAIVPNGIVPEHFEQEVKRNPLKVIYASTHERGLEAVLDMWPKIKEQVPEAELHYYYGWEVFDALQRHNPEKMKWKLNIIRKAYKAGAIDHGRISHEELAKEMLSAGVWFYPTMFPEISCITAMKAGAAGLDAVTSGYAALAETQLHGFMFDGNTGIDPLDTYKDEKRQAQMIEQVVKYLKAPKAAADRKLLAKSYQSAYAWKHIAKGWDDAIRSSNSSL